MCACTCHTELGPHGITWSGCGDCAHLHTAEELVSGPMAADAREPESITTTTPEECGCACHPTSIGNCGTCSAFHAVAPHVCTPECRGTRDGAGAGDHDQPYTWDRKPTVQWPFPFNATTFGRLLRMRAGIDRTAMRNRGLDEKEAA